MFNMLSDHARVVNGGLPQEHHDSSGRVTGEGQQLPRPVSRGRRAAYRRRQAHRPGGRCVRQTKISAATSPTKNAAISSIPSMKRSIRFLRRRGPGRPESPPASRRAASISLKVPAIYPSVIPGRPEGPDPESSRSLDAALDSGFALRAPRNDAGTREALDCGPLSTTR